MIVDFHDAKLSAADVHDARSRRRGTDPCNDVPRIESGGATGSLERLTVEEGHRIRAAAEVSPALAKPFAPRNFISTPAAVRLFPSTYPWL
jgi:hypothetical protein